MSDDLLTGVDIHPAAEIVPLIEGKDFENFTIDIRDNGLQEPVVFTPDGQLLDGRNRYRACRRLGIEPGHKVVADDPWKYVVSANIHRRHLSESQRAMAGARMATRHGGQRSRSAVPIGTADLAPSRSEAADLLNISTTSISRAKQIIKHGVKGLQDSVDSGAIPAYTAVRVATELEPVEQEEFVRRVANGAKPSQIAPPDTEQIRRTRAARTVQNPSALPERNNRSPKRHQYVTVPNVEALLFSLEGLAVVLDTTGGRLDPSITDGEAVHLVDGLSEGLRHARRLQKLLIDRKEHSTNV